LYLSPEVMAYPVTMRLLGSVNKLPFCCKVFIVFTTFGGNQMNKKPLRIMYYEQQVDFDEGLECPCCGHNVIVEDGTSACPHLVFVWLTDCSEFDFAVDDFAAKFEPLWEDRSARYEAAMDELYDIREPLKDVDPLGYELARKACRELGNLSFLDILKTCGYEGNLEVVDAIQPGFVSFRAIHGFENDAIIGDESTITIP
jgi:hypothetical protein